MFFIYVLHSQTTGRFYTGLTSDLQARMQQHNSGQSISTKNRGSWDLVHSEQFATLSEAVRRERYLKTGKGRDEIKWRVPKNSTVGSTG
jgi:putative endonuclease